MEAIGSPSRFIRSKHRMFASSSLRRAPAAPPSAEKKIQWLVEVKSKNQAFFFFFLFFNFWKGQFHRGGAPVLRAACTPGSTQLRHARSIPPATTRPPAPSWVMRRGFALSLRECRRLRGCSCAGEAVLMQAGMAAYGHGPAAAARHGHYSPYLASGYRAAPPAGMLPPAVATAVAAAVIFLTVLLLAKARAD